MGNKILLNFVAILLAGIFFVINDAIINFLSPLNIKFYHFVFYGTPVYLCFPIYLIMYRKFNEKNSKDCQITLIEIENINYFNKVSNTNILPIDFRRNIITEGIRLNQLVGKEFFIGNVKLKGHDLCRPCKYLQEKLKQNNLIKEFLYKGGLRCEILTSGKIYVGDIIK